jgi:squalene-hopene/tetraprenyl-beta-curcumene cyclase
MPIMCRHPLLFAFAMVAAAGCSRRPAQEPALNVDVNAPADSQDGIPPPRLIERTPEETALRGGVQFLLSRQSDDGAWRSDVYATFKDGTALTPLVLVALQDAHEAGVRSEAVEAAIRKGAAWLTRFSKADGSIETGPDGIDYPIYTAALAVKAFSHPTTHQFLLARDGWVRYLKDRQLTEKLGWKPEDKQYGGWGYCRVLPRRPEPGVFAPPLIESNLSATLFALDALSTAGEMDTDTRKAAALFARRCQNYPLPNMQGSQPWSSFLDGGFHFIYDDPTRNKAGMIPAEVEGQPQLFHSYGSTTADGLRILKLCDLPEDSPRVEAAVEWLGREFRADTHPGRYVKSHEPNRDAVYYYYAVSLSRTFRLPEVQSRFTRIWAEGLAGALVRRRNEEGGWRNMVELVRENDSLVASSNAVSALSNCVLSRR